ncbi:MAG TPA: helix-turn-helix transcriptional regulator [Acidobacteriota bacterium]|nr:helix-turn-helix transcriptional regulator [Acidobacteriota bacterium]
MISGSVEKGKKWKEGLAAFLREARKEAGLSTTAIADSSKDLPKEFRISPGYVTHLEQGLSLPSAPKLLTIARALGRPVSDFYRSMGALPEELCSHPDIEGDDYDLYARVQVLVQQGKKEQLEQQIQLLERDDKDQRRLRELMARCGASGAVLLLLMPGRASAVVQINTPFRECAALLKARGERPGWKLLRPKDRSRLALALRSPRRSSKIIETELDVLFIRWQKYDPE